MAKKRHRRNTTPAPGFSGAPAAPTDSVAALSADYIAPTAGWTAKPALVNLAVFSLACVAYLNALPNGYVYDDIVIVQENERIRTLTDPAKIWLTDWWYAPPDQSEERHRDRLYRPLVMQTFALNYAVSGTNTWSYHLFDIALHAACCVIIVALTRRLFGDARLAAWTGMLFAVLPVHVESVANIVGRADVMGTLFCILGAYCLSRELSAAPSTRRLLWRIGALLCVPAALFCKELAVCLPALLLLTEWYLRRRDRPGRAAPPPGKRPAFWLGRIGGFYLWVAVGVAGYLLLRWVSLEHHLVRDVPPAVMDNPLSEATGAQRFWTPFKLLTQYLLVTFWPGNLCCDYSFDSFPLSSSPADLKTLAGLAAIVAAVWAWARVPSRRRDTLLFALLFFAVSYAMISNSFLVIGTILGERLFYLPSLPLCWLVIIGLGDLYAHLKRRDLLGGAGLHLAPALAWTALLVLTARTAMRCGDWRNPETLFATDLQTHPRSARLQLFVARSLIDRKEYDRALLHLEKSLAIYPEYANAQANAGLIYALAGDWATARKYYMLARQLLWENPSLQAQYERFRLFYEGGRRFPEKELQEVSRAAATQPADLELQLRLADLQAGLGQYRQGTETLSNILAQGSTDRRARFDLAALLIIDEQFARARTLLEGLLAETPDDWRVHSQLAVLFATSDPEASLRHALRAVKIQPLLFETRMNLIQALVENRRFQEALEHLQELGNMLPADEPAHRLIDRQMRIVKERL